MNFKYNFFFENYSLLLTSNFRFIFDTLKLLNLKSNLKDGFECINFRGRGKCIYSQKRGGVGAKPSSAKTM